MRDMPEVTERCLLARDLPPRLSDLDSPPKRLFLRGELPRGPSIAIVGTRHPSKPAAAFARELAHALAVAGVAVLSGGAEGIDTEAHRGALSGDGVTVVVAPAGFDHPFPAQNAELFQRIVDRGGAYLSLVEKTRPATSSAFFTRNAYLVALAHVVVVVESPIRSGARNAAAHARRLGRPLFVVPAAPWHAKGRGCLAELQLGARVLISVRDLLRELAAQNLHALPPARRPPPALAEAQKSLAFIETWPPREGRSAVISALREGATEADAICLRSGLSAARVSELILTLRLEGVLVTDPLGRLQLNKQLI